jgi:hypothetical protein
MPRHKEATVVVLRVLHLTAYGKPVHVYVGNRHKDRDLEHLLLDILIIRNDLRHHNTAIAGREDEFVIVNLHTAGLAEEGHDKEPKDEEQRAEYPEIYTHHGLDEEERSKPQGNTYGARHRYNDITLLINLHSLW